MRLIRDEEDLREGLQHLVAVDPRLLPVVAAAGPLPLRLAEPDFAGMTFIIVSQMISKASAAAIWRRISAAGPVTAHAWLAHHSDTIGSFGLSRAKIATIANLAEAVEQQGLDLEAICRIDPAAAMGQLTSLPGIGPWTAEVYLMFCGGHADVFPAGDVALQASLARAFALPERPAARATAAIAAAWVPWRSVAARLFWSYYSVSLRKDVAPLAPVRFASKC
jgi:DNA-3-methyladenine glycosylase II